MMSCAFVVAILQMLQLSVKFVSACQSIRSFASRLSILVGGKLILKKTSSLGILWDEKLPVSISECWKNGFRLWAIPMSLRFQVIASET